MSAQGLGDNGREINRYACAEVWRIMMSGVADSRRIHKSEWWALKVQERMEEKSMARHVPKCRSRFKDVNLEPEEETGLLSGHNGTLHGVLTPGRTCPWVDTQMQHSESINAVTKNHWINWISLYIGSKCSFPLAILTICYFCICQYSSFFIQNRSRLVWSFCLRAYC